jgi:hypothetical protein
MSPRRRKAKRDGRELRDQQAMLVRLGWRATRAELGWRVMLEELGLREMPEELGRQALRAKQGWRALWARPGQKALPVNWVMLVHLDFPEHLNPTAQERLLLASQVH